MNRKDHVFLDLVDGDWVSICRNEWELLTGILLDTRTPLERLRRTLAILRDNGHLDYRILRTHPRREVEKILRDAGYPWAKQKSYCFQQDIDFNLLDATFEQIDSIKGIGPKLASLWMRITHPNRQNEFVVIDTHVRRWIRTELGINDSEHSYEELSDILRQQAAKRGITITELDSQIVEAGIRKRRGILV